MSEARLPLRVVVREWGRIGVTGFGGPPAHIALLRRMCIDHRGWLTADEFEAAISACNLLPGPASTQLSIYCAYRVAGRRGGLVGGLAFILPAIVIVLGLSVLFLAQSPPLVIAGAGAGAGAAVAAVAVYAARGLFAPSWSKACDVGGGRRARWLAYVLIGILSAALIGQFVVLALLACGAVELAANVGPGSHDRLATHALPGLLALGAVAATGGIGALVWEAFKVGALSYGGGFVIIPLMQASAVHTYHWMTAPEFLNAVALGQVSPGPVVATVAAVGYAAHGILGGLLASAVAFAPSFVFVLVAGGRFDQIRGSRSAQAFIDGAGPAAVGAILGAAVPLALGLRHGWQVAVLAGAAVALLAAKRGVVETLLGAGAVGVILALVGVPVR